jgi:hypothetical protein
MPPGMQWDLENRDLQILNICSFELPRASARGKNLHELEGFSPFCICFNFKE